MLEISYQLKLFALQSAKRRQRRHFQNEREKLERREAGGELIPMVGKRDGIDALVVQEMRPSGAIAPKDLLESWSWFWSWFLVS